MRIIMTPGALGGMIGGWSFDNARRENRDVQVLPRRGEPLRRRGTVGVLPLFPPAAWVLNMRARKKEVDDATQRRTRSRNVRLDDTGARPGPRVSAAGGALPGHTARQLGRCAPILGGRACKTPSAARQPVPRRMVRRGAAASGHARCATGRLLNMRAPLKWSRT